MGVSRDTFYRYQKLVESGNVDSLINRSRLVTNMKNCVDNATEQAVIDFVIQFPAYGQHPTSNELRKMVYLFQVVGFDLFGLATI